MAIAHEFQSRIPKLSLQKVLVVPFLLQIAAATAIAGALSFYNGQRAVQSIALDLSSEATSNIEQHLIGFAKLPHTFLQITQAAIATGQLDPTDLDALEDYFYQVVQLEQPVRSIYYGDESGQFVLVKQEDERALTYLLSEDTAPIRNIYALDANGNRAELLQSDPYDPRDRPWYLAATRADGPTWSPIYYFAAQPVLGITPALSIRTPAGELQGVLAVDITLSQLDSFLAGLQIGKRGQAFILGRGGEMVASSKPGLLAPVEQAPALETERVRLLATNSRDPRLQTVGEYLLQRFGSFEAIEPFQELVPNINGESQFLQVKPLRDGSGLDWLMVVVIPRSDLTGAIDQNVRDTILLCIAALAVAVLFGHGTSRWIARPILRLSAVARDMAADGPDALREVPHSSVEELEVLSASFENMAKQLHSNFESLTKSNEELEHRVKKRTAELQSAEQRMRAIFAAMTEVIMTFDRQGRYVSIAPTNPSLLLASADSLVGKRLQDYLPEVEANLYLEYIHAAIDGGKTTDFEYQLEIEGGVIWFAGRISPASDSMALWVARDITERKLAEAALLQSEVKFATAFRSSSSPVAIATLKSGKFLDVNDSFLQVSGFKRQDVIGKTGRDLGLWRSSNTRREVLKLLKTSGVMRNLEIEFNTRSGEVRALLLSADLIEISGETCILYVGNDITERKQAQAALQQAEAKYRSIFEQALEGICQIAPDGKLIGANPALAAMYGYSNPEEMMVAISNVHQQLYTDPLHRQEFLDLLEAQGAVETYESEVRRRDGSTFWVNENLRAVRDPSDRLLYYVGTVENITARKEVEEELRFHAFHDALTGLPNRALFNDRLGQVIERVKRRLNYLYAVLFLDLDRFKTINDTLGHAVGDRLLIIVAQRLQQCVRAGDTISRLGGDEFTILLDDMGEVASAVQTAERILESVSQPLVFGDRTVITSTSIGIAIGTPQYQSSADILRDADAAMYAAKTTGRNCYKIFDSTLHSPTSSHFQH